MSNDKEVIKDLNHQLRMSCIVISLEREKIEDCRQYVMTTAKEEIEVEEILTRLGFNENGY